MPVLRSDNEEGGWLGRLGGALFGVLFGILLLIGAIVLLFWNESNVVTTRKALAEAERAVVAVDSQPLTEANDGELVHVAGRVTTPDRLVDAPFGIAVTETLQLTRSVEMFQWRERREEETRTRADGTKETVETFRYDRGWSGDLVDSDGFRNAADHRNPDSMPASDLRLDAPTTMLGDFRVGSRVLGKLQGGAPVPADILAAVADLEGRAPQVRGDWVHYGNPDNPAIGDVRVRFTRLPEQEASVIAAQRDGALAPWPTAAGKEIFLAEAGIVAPETMFRNAHGNATALLWVLRVAGSLLLVGAFALILSPLAVLAEPIPLVNRVVGAGVGFAALVLGAATAIVTIAIAWIAVRPVAALAVCAVVTVVVVAAIAGRGGSRTSVRRAAGGPATPPPFPGRG